MSVPLHNPEKSLGETLQYMSSSITQPTVSLRELLELIGEQGMLVFCMFLTIPFLLPVSIPGVSTVFGLVITLIGIGVAFNRVPWLPARLMNRTIERIHLIPALEKGAALFTRLDKVVSPRILALTHGATINRLNGLLLILGAILLMAPFGLIPFSNTLPALAILFLAVGMLQRDGIFVLLGYLALVATIVYFGALVGAAILAGQGLSSLLGSG
ncbi:MAG: exopolysaccharide biosynthesis protein [Chloroflexi bacterium]|nr:exopolysaccharide biosynthesis protein [Chloroflexota bacterium]MCC6892495.1 exopolysaccharide biosynthesis protein [Anaerolineae bacterium]